MIKRKFTDRLLALVLAAAMFIPAAAYALDEPKAENDPGAVPETGITAEDPADEPEQTSEPEEPAQLGKTVIAENPMGTVTIKWYAFRGAAYYKVSSPGVRNGRAYKTSKRVYTASGLKHGARYRFTIEAFNKEGKVIATGAISIKTAPYKIKFNESRYRTVTSRILSPKRKFRSNLTKLIREPDSGYAVVQGGCTDGRYAYYMMVSTATQRGRVLKVRMSDNKVVKRSGVLNIWHGNGMAYDSKRKKLVVIAREHRKQEITIIDASTLRITKQRNARYDYRINAGSPALNRRYKQSGLAAIAYVRRYDCYIALERENHNLLIFDPDTFECIGLVYTKLGTSNPGTFQGMDADEKYVYLLLSYYKEGKVVQPYNKIVVLDWNSEILLPVVNRCKSKDPKFVRKAWRCKNDHSGKADGTIFLRTKREAENIYHTTGRNGRCHFYLAEFYGHNVRGKYRRENYVYDLGVI